ncbi:unnamed protein product [Lactuca virosa]|uniref:Uncharacterized protein n=1 Tax=Lactuca virosa TaxID=75947 RepID=A0AAU9PVB9_9ASTR|nr:unnamed protein product [Lactuca virosa]
MGQSKKLKNLQSICKDKAKIIKATFSITNRTTSSIQIAVLRATNRSSQSPPHDHHVSTLLSLGNTTRHSCFCMYIRHPPPPPPPPSTKCLCSTQGSFDPTLHDHPRFLFSQGTTIVTTHVHHGL